MRQHKPSPATYSLFLSSPIEDEYEHAPTQRHPRRGNAVIHSHLVQNTVDVSLHRAFLMRSRLPISRLVLRSATRVSTYNSRSVNPGLLSRSANRAATPGAICDFPAHTVRIHSSNSSRGAPLRMYPFAPPFNAR